MPGRMWKFSANQQYEEKMEKSEREKEKQRHKRNHVKCSSVEVEKLLFAICNVAMFITIIR